MNDKELTIKAEEDARRLDVFLAEKSDLTRSGIKNLISLDKVTVNGQAVKAGQKISAGDIV